MPEKPIPDKKDEKKLLQQLVIENNAQARITYELARQLEAHLPITSFKKLMGDLHEVVVDKQRLSLKIFAPHVSEDVFPIENIEDLVRTLSTGVKTALAVADSPSFPIRNPAVRSILATTRQEDPTRRLGTPVVFGGLSAAAIKPHSTGGA